MAFDRIVRFEPGKVPPREDVGKVLEDYLGEVMTDLHWGGGRWTAVIAGHKSWPFRRVYDEQNECLRTIALAMRENETEKRWIEVFIGDDNIAVITRRADDLTGAVADGFAKLVARYWRGRLEPSG